MGYENGDGCFGFDVGLVVLGAVVLEMDGLGALVALDVVGGCGC